MIPYTDSGSFIHVAAAHFRSRTTHANVAISWKVATRSSLVMAEAMRTANVRPLRRAILRLKNVQTGLTRQWCTHLLLLFVATRGQRWEGSDPTRLQVDTSVEHPVSRRCRFSVRVDFWRSGVRSAARGFCVSAGGGAFELALWRRGSVLGS